MRPRCQITTVAQRDAHLLRRESESGLIPESLRVGRDATVCGEWVGMPPGWTRRAPGHCDKAAASERKATQHAP